MTWHTFPVAPDELFLTVQHEQLGPLSLLLPWIGYSTDARLVFLDSCLRFYVVCLKDANMHVLINLNDMECKMHGECECMKMYLLETIFVKENFIYFNK